MTPEMTETESKQRIKALEEELITNRKIIDAQREREARYRNIFDHLPEEIHFWQLVRDGDSRIKTWELIDANPAALRTWGRPLEEVRGKTIDEILGPGATEHYRPVVEKITTEGIPFTYEDYFPPLAKHFHFTSFPFRENFVTIGNDISEKKLAEDRLLRERNFIKALLDSTGACVVVMDRQGRILRFNKACEAMTGYEAEEVMGRAFWEFLIPSEDLQGVMETWESLRAGDFPKHHENRWVTKEGSQKILVWSNMAILDKEGGITHVISTGIDITEKKLLDEALTNSQKKYQDLMEKAHSIILKMDLQGQITYFNEFAQKFFGYVAEEILGKKATGTIIPSDISTGRDPNWLIAALKKDPACYEDDINENMKRSGERVWIAWSNKPLYDELGLLVEILCVGRDVTEQRQMEAALQEREQWYAASFEQSPAVKLLINPENGDIVDANWTASQFYGYSPAQLKAMKITEINRLPADQIRTTLARVAANHQNRFVFRHQLASGETRDVEVYSGPIVMNNRHLVHSIIHDITDRTEAEKALKESEEKYRTLFATSDDPLFLVDQSTMAILEVNEAACRLYGYTLEEMVTLKTTDLSAEPEETEKAMLSSIDGIYTRLHRKKDGSTFPVDIRNTIFNLKDRKIILGSIRDASHRQEGETYRKLTHKVLTILNETEDFQTSVEHLVAAVKKATECSAVGIRLQKGEDYPYFYQEGFSTDFLKSENSLMSLTPAVGPDREAGGLHSLECICGLIISEKTDPADPLFTPNGGFWTNDTAAKLEFPEWPPSRLNPRDQCLQYGYASVALLPIREKRKVVGIFQLNDFRKGFFSPPAIKALEGIANHIGEALLRKKYEQTLRERTLELEEMTETLEKRVKKRTRELEATNANLRRVSSKLLTAQEDERKKIAAELHDSLAGYLAGIKAKLEHELDRIAEKPDFSFKGFKDIIPQIQECIDECRRIQMDLRPPMLDTLGLLKSLSWFVRVLTKTYPALQIDQEIEIEEEDIPPHLKIVIFRVIQEAMNNIVKSSQTKEAILSLDKDENILKLYIRDYGKGFDLKAFEASEQPRLGFGLDSMRERVSLSGGTLAIESTLGKGTVIKASWIIPDALS